MVSIGDIILVSAIGLALFFREDLGKALESFKGFGTNFGAVNLPDININVPKLPEVDLSPLFEGIPKAFAEGTEGIGQAGIDIQKAIFDAGVEARKGFDLSIQEAQRNFEQNISGIQTGIAEAGEASLVFGADIQEGITGDRNFFLNLFTPAPQVEIEKTDGAPVTTPTSIIDSRRTGTATRFGGQTEPKLTLTQEEASTPKESSIIISPQPDLSLVSPFLKTSQVIEGEKLSESRFSGSGSRR